MAKRKAPITEELDPVEWGKANCPIWDRSNCEGCTYVRYNSRGYWTTCSIWVMQRDGKIYD